MVKLLKIDDIKHNFNDKMKVPKRKSSHRITKYFCSFKGGLIIGFSIWFIYLLLRLIL